MSVRAPWPATGTTAVQIAVRNVKARMAARNIDVRQMSATEVVGRVNVICTDMNGVITSNHMTLGAGRSPQTLGGRRATACAHRL